MADEDVHDCSDYDTLFRWLGITSRLGAVVCGLFFRLLLTFMSWREALAIACVCGCVAILTAHLGLKSVQSQPHPSALPNRHPLPSPSAYTGVSAEDGDGCGDVDGCVDEGGCEEDDDSLISHHSNR